MVGVLSSLFSNNNYWADPQTQGGVLGAAGGAPTMAPNPAQSAPAQPPAVGQPPMTWQQRLQLIGATLRDASSNLSGRPEDANNIGTYQQNQQAIAQRGARAQALSDYQNATTPEDRQAAMVRLWASGADTAGLGAVLKSQEPTFHDIGANGAVATDNIGNVIHTFAGAPKLPQRPLISNGMQSLDNGATWGQIPGYVKTQQDVAGARRAPPKAAAPGALAIPHPSSMY